MLDVKTTFLQGKTMERTAFVRPPKEANADKVWDLQKCVYGLADVSRFWYLKLKEEIIRLGGIPPLLDKGIFVLTNEQIVIGIFACFVDDILLGGNQEFSYIIKQLKIIFKIGAEYKEILDYIGINLQNTGFSKVHDQNQ